jgi:ClpP class serine protease
MNTLPRPADGRNRSIVRGIKFVLALVVGLVVLDQLTGASRLRAARNNLLEKLQNQRGSRVVAMIHREETVSLFGMPVSSSIDIEDSEAILRAIRLTPPEQPIDIILHTPGGLVLAAEQIAHALIERQGPVTVFVPHYAMSGGTLIALAADSIVMDPNAVLGPVDPQIGDMAAASLVSLGKRKPQSAISDEMLILMDVAAKARIQVAEFVLSILRTRLPADSAIALAEILSEGRWTHDFPITIEQARALALPISVSMPRLVYDLMDLYPQAGAGRPSVLYVPTGARHSAEQATRSPRKRG